MKEVVVGALVGGGTKEFLGLLSAAGKAWIAERFGVQQGKAAEKAKENANSFQEILGRKVAALEESGEVLSATLNQAMEDPDLGWLIHKALMGSAQTDSKQKHEMLAGLVSARLRVENDSRLAVAAHMCCEQVSQLTTRQLRLLVYFYLMSAYIPKLSVPKNEFVTHRTLVESVNELYKPWVEALGDLEQVNYVDVMHLESVGVIQSGTVLNLPDVITKHEVLMLWGISPAELLALPVFQQAVEFWGKHELRNKILTSAGLILGATSTQILTGRGTAFGVDWE